MSPTGSDGSTDVARAASDLADRLPPELAPLARLALNYRWSWLPAGRGLFESLDPGRYQLCCENPVRALQEASSERLRMCAADRGLIDRVDSVARVLDAERPPEDQHPIAFFCAEYGVHQSLPVYSGGLGALAGDLLKEASDLAVPMVAVGLLYREGYFRQRIDASGWQHEYWVPTDPARTPAVLVTAPDGAPLTVEVPIGSSDVTVRIWRVDVGRVPLYLLDTDCPENGEIERWITARLYVGDSLIRLSQYAILGVGGMRALAALGIAPSLIHLNEGHAALAPLELARQLVEEQGISRQEALAAARERTVFTTHTPVPAGNDSYPELEILAVLTRALEQLGMTPSELIELGRTNPEDPHEPCGVTQAALRLSRTAGGVSERHGQVAREMWARMWPERPLHEVPIGHVTNGVHIPTWIGDPMRELLDRHLGEDWMARAADAGAWEALEQISDEELWSVRCRQRVDLVEWLRRRSVVDRLGRGDVGEYVAATSGGLGTDVLTLGFARRVATYKRLHLLIEDPDWTLSVLTGDRPIQVVLAGKAHPRDDEAKQVLQRLFGMKHARVVAERVVFLDDYDLATAARLVRGCDVWLNLPRPPLEASGTSGMKSAVNGGLQLSVLDGWWAEAYDGANGWAIPGDVVGDPGAQDRRDSEIFHHLITDEVLPAFYDRDEHGVPRAWLSHMRASLRTIVPQFTGRRMVGEYVANVYRR